jgi:NTP pyrophosphatase (non-canonical NTP hydrolase)
MSKLFDELMHIAKQRLDKCPWAQRQTLESWTKFAAKEVEELRCAAEKNDFVNIEEELGDILFCVMSATSLMERDGRFSMEGVLDIACAKIRFRNPHVFGDAVAKTVEEATILHQKAKEGK